MVDIKRLDSSEDGFYAALDKVLAWDASASWNHQGYPRTW